MSISPGQTIRIVQGVSMPADLKEEIQTAASEGGWDFSQVMREGARMWLNHFYKTGHLRPKKKAS